MLRLLHIENIAVIEKADIEFGAGLNVLTGETGAGKSIVIDALSAVTGSRASRDVIRTGAEYASVTAVFADVGDGARLEDYGAEPDESGEVFISRKISSDGKSACRVNGTPVSASQLRELCSGLLDIHGQNDGRKLLDEGVHIAYLDTFAAGMADASDGKPGATANVAAAPDGKPGVATGGQGCATFADTLCAYKAAYREIGGKKAAIAKLSMDESEKERRIDALKYQIDEIDRAKLRLGEFDELSSRRELLLNATKLIEAAEAAHVAMHGGDSGTGASVGAVALLSEAHASMERASRYYDGLRELLGRIADLRYAAQDVADELRDVHAGLEFTPGELDTLEERLDVLQRIRRKYGGESEALEHLENGKSELSEIEDSSDRLLTLEDELKAVVQQAGDLAGKLSAMRKAAAKTLQKRIKGELSELNMPAVSFEVEFVEARGEYGLCANGCDEVRFLMSANAGEAPGRISRIASGGELSRIMLAMKNALGADRDTGVAIFDEIDAGVSGIAAQRVGEKLAQLARRRQVLCVTHLPQIAVMADTHFEIQKSVSGGRTFTSVSRLDFDGRKREIARLSGGEHVTETTLTSAAEQLEAAAEYKLRM
jgi:DNA repair protein RecN (Recombination protein N)